VETQVNGLLVKLSFLLVNIRRLTPAEKKATNRAKAKGNKKGKQFVAQPKKIAKKAARYR